MSQISRVTTWASNQVLTASALNGEFNNLINAWNNQDSGASSWTILKASGAATLSSTLAVTGATTLGSTLGVTGAATLNSTLAVTGSSILTGIVGIGVGPSTYTLRIKGGNTQTLGVDNDGSQFTSAEYLNSGVAKVSNIWDNNINIFYWSSSAASYSFRNGSTHLLDLATTGSSLLGTTTNDSASTGYVGEYVVSTVNVFANMAATGTFGNITSISLTAGDWDVIGQAMFNAAGASHSDGYGTVISTFTGNTTTDHVKGVNLLYSTPATLGNQGGTTVIYRLSLASTTTVYLKGQCNVSSGTPQALGTIYGRRRR